LGKRIFLRKRVLLKKKEYLRKAYLKKKKVFLFFKEER
jgi:hypothetical protein